MANTNASGIEYLSSGTADGACVNKSGTKSSAYGATPVDQASNIAAETSAVSTTKFNAVLSILSNWGLMAKS